MKTIIVAIFMILLLFTYVYGADRAKGATPYGALCPLCGAYGYCKEQPSKEEAEHALQKYYEKNGLKAVIVKGEGRFLEADIYDGEEIVDKVLLDLKTGRLRSIH